MYKKAIEKSGTPQKVQTNFSKPCEWMPVPMSFYERPGFSLIQWVKSNPIQKPIETFLALTPMIT